jgi:hypothetical protein
MTRDKRRVKVFGNRVLRGIFGLKKDEIIGTWGRIHNEELHNYSPNTIKMTESRTTWVGHVARMA